ncbi:hypothetical protein [Mycolicibacterium fortuitum]|uniref:hypothetical protein n=1 Tax=Mycolicibacterium fortuitum TaxID=1766 RepID=UPI00262F7506|nr:hypothetical protein [Mycolicibacterium fortuitum]
MTTTDTVLVAVAALVGVITAAWLTGSWLAELEYRNTHNLHHNHDNCPICTHTEED